MTTLHAQATNTLVHAAQSTGEVTTVILQYNLVDEAGNQYVDEAGNEYITLDYVAAPIMHAQATNTLIHTE